LLKLLNSAICETVNLLSRLAVPERTENPRVDSSTLSLSASNYPPNASIAYLSYFNIERSSRYYTAFSRIISSSNSDDNVKNRIRL